MPTMAWKQAFTLIKVFVLGLCYLDAAADSFDDFHQSLQVFTGNSDIHIDKRSLKWIGASKCTKELKGRCVFNWKSCGPDSTVYGKCYRRQKCCVDKPCHNSPCLHSGICTNNGNNYSCECPFPYAGTRCESKITCIPSPCLNGGLCQARADGSFDQCFCPPGFCGLTCDCIHNRFTGNCNCGSAELVPCVSGPCQNGGTCISTETGPECKCLFPFTGPSCQNRVACDPNPCSNGGKCVANNDGNAVRCTCPLQSCGLVCDCKRYLATNNCLCGSGCTECVRT